MIRLINYFPNFIQFNIIKFCITIECRKRFKIEIFQFLLVDQNVFETFNQ